MSDLTTLTTLLDLTQHAPMIEAKKITDTVDGLAGDVVATIRVVAVAVVCAFVLIVAAKNRFAAAPILMATLVGGFVLWLVWGGVDKMKEGTEEQLAAPAAVVQIHLPPETATHLSV